jgi:hypothetical protein
MILVISVLLLLSEGAATTAGLSRHAVDLHPDLAIDDAKPELMSQAAIAAGNLHLPALRLALPEAEPFPGYNLFVFAPRHRSAP